MLKRTLVALGSVLTLVACGSTDVSTSTPSPSPSAQYYYIKCSFVVTLDTHEIGIVFAAPSKVDSATACGALSKAFDPARNAGASVTETDGQAIDFTQVGPDITVACSSNGVTVYQHSQDSVSQQMATAFCNGMSQSSPTS